MKFFRLDLLTLLISLFIFNSCKNQDTIGLTGNSSQLSGSLLDTATIFTNTVTDDSVITSGIAKSPMGYFNDPVFGTTEADLVTDLNLPNSTAYTLPTGTITIDSAVLILKYADGFYGDSISSKYKVNVYQLGERVYQNQTYYNIKGWKLNQGNTIIGSRSFYSRTHDSIGGITSIVSGGPDTLTKVPPQLRIPIDTTFIRNILFGAPANQLASNLIFKNNVKGLFISIDKTQTTGAGGIFMFQNPAADSLAVYYHSKNGSTVDTAQVYLNISQHACQIIHVPLAPISNALAKTKENVSDNVIYLQGLAGLRGKISFPYLQKLFDSIPGGKNNVIINRAELVVTVLPGSDIPSYLVPQPKLTLYRLDIAHQRTSVEDASTADPRNFGAGLFGGFYNSTTRNYHFLVTAYIQDLISGKTIDYGTYIAPIDNTNTTSVDIAATPQTAGRTIAVGNDKTSPYRIKLNVIYTQINQIKK